MSSIFGFWSSGVDTNVVSPGQQPSVDYEIEEYKPIQQEDHPAIPVGDQPHAQSTDEVGPANQQRTGRHIRFPSPENGQLSWGPPSKRRRPDCDIEVVERVETDPQELVDVSRLRSLEAALSQANERNNTLQAQLSEEISSRKKLYRTCQAQQQKLSAVTQKVQESEAELQELRGLLSTYDDVSAEEVGNMLRDLNDRIEEAARDNANLWIDRSKGNQRRPSEPIQDGLFERLHDCLGKEFMDVLGSINSGHPSTIFLLQAAWQACIVNTVAYMLRMFHSAMVAQAGQSKLLNQICSSMRQEESQPIYGRWRALAYHHISQLQKSEHRQEALGTCYQETISSCYIVARTLLRAHSPSLAELTSTFEEPLVEIISATEKFGRVLKEKVITMDYFPYKPSKASSSRYDPEGMSLTDDDDPPRPGAPVLCTVKLGLATRCKPGRARNAKVEYALFRKPQVVTVHCIEAAEYDYDDDTHASKSQREDPGKEVVPDSEDDKES